MAKVRPLLALLLALAPLPVAAQSAPSSAEFGRLSYRLFCVGCHGPDGKGNGAVAISLGMPLSDLTQIAKDNDGIFPAAEVEAAINGTSTVRGHRSLAMTPWAQQFELEFDRFAAKAAVNDMVARRIDHIVAYLQSIQEQAGRP
jgi:hypothetical protein